MDRLDPKLDLVFKLLLTRDKVLLGDMLEAVLAKPIHELVVLDSDIPGERTSDKTIILDIRAVLDDGSRIDLEMQIRTAPTLPARLVYYGARDYADQLGRGDGYHLLTPTVVIVWLVDPLFSDLERLHSIFELRERDTHQLFSDQLAIHVLQLASLRPSHAPSEDVRVERWARFLMAREDAELDQLASEDPIMRLAKETLDQLSQDPATRRLARERSDALELYEIDLTASRAAGREEGRAAGREEGRAAGRKEGRAGLVLELLATRFGPLPEETPARVEAATIQQLEVWAKRVLTAETLDDVLAP